MPQGETPSSRVELAHPEPTALALTTTRPEQEDFVKLMHSKGAAIDYKNDKGKTPLMIAVAFQRHELIAYFIENGADVKARGGPGHAQCPTPNAQRSTPKAQRPMPNAQCPNGSQAHGTYRRSTGRAGRSFTSRAGSATSR